MPFLPNNIADDREAKQQAIKELLDNASHNIDYYVLLVGAILLAIGGIFADSIPVVIASMIVAPLAFPILGIGLGLSVWDLRLVGRISGLFLLSCGVALGLAMVITLVFHDTPLKDVYVTFTGNRFLAVFVAVVAGAIAAFGTMRPKVASAITGVAIAVSLMPPLVATGIGLASGDYKLAADGSTLFGLNILGILAAAIAVFKWAKIGREYRSLPSVRR